MACRWLQHYSDPFEAELDAHEEGAFSALLVPSSIELESDCSEAVTLLNGVTLDRSKYVHVVKEIRALNEAEHPVKLASISRTQNYASHGMSAVGRGQQLTACWLGNFPLEIGGAIQSNCNSMVSQ